MSSWSKRRRLLYSGLVLVFLLAAIGVPAFFFLYQKPTCFDRILNGGEYGVDCGGGCERLCPSAFKAPQIAWTRFEQVAPGLYNVAAYIVNPNTTGEAKNVPYHMALYDGKGLLITEYTDTMTLPPQRSTLAFRGSVPVGSRVPAKAFFEFTGSPDWVKSSDTLGSVSVENKEYTEDVAGSSLLVTLKNNDVYPIGRMAVFAILYDAAGNTLGFSKTFVDEIKPKATAVAPFTWPKTHEGKVISIDVLIAAE